MRSMEAAFLVMWQVCTGQSQRLPTALAPRAAEAKAYVRPFDGGPAKNPDNPVQALYDMVIDRLQTTCISPRLIWYWTGRWRQA